MDYPTLRSIQRANPPGLPKFFVPVGNRPWFKQHLNCDDDQVFELDWWDSRTVEVVLPGALEGEGKGRDRVRTTFVPSQHMSRRTPFDMAKSSVLSSPRPFWR